MSEIKPALTWRPVVGYEGFYEVSDIGLVRSLHPTRGKVLSNANDRGYHRVSLSMGSVVKNVSVHKLVAEAYIGPRPLPHLVVNHKDGRKNNNTASNLEYITNAANQRHASMLGLKASGESHGQAKLRDVQVSAVRREFAGGLSIGRLCALTGISHRQIERLVRQRSRHVA